MLTTAESIERASHILSCNWFASTVDNERQTEYLQLAPYRGQLMSVHGIRRSAVVFFIGRGRKHIAVTTVYHASEGVEVEFCGEGGCKKAEEGEHSGLHLWFSNWQWKLKNEGMNHWPMVACLENNRFFHMAWSEKWVVVRNETERTFHSGELRRTIRLTRSIAGPGSKQIFLKFTLIYLFVKEKNRNLW